MPMPRLSSLARHVAPAVLAAHVLLVPAHPASALPTAAPCSAPSGCGPVSVGPVSQEPPDHGPCASPEPVVCMIRSETPEEREDTRDERERYHQLLADMEREACAMRAAGLPEEEVARTLVQMRNDAKDIIRAGMTPEQVAELEERNQKKYGNPLGPTADQLYVKYGSWEKVSEAATRSNEAVDRELGLEFRHCSCDVLRAA
ncbi:hypothetical protein ACSNOH_04095 [Streptomyces sp. URMC 127]|uniref:hypothetical protein n=1 Tax=Streptomyces sp. URMC 127 TaxID=3423402 RepID=UPI003F1AE157